MPRRSFLFALPLALAAIAPASAATTFKLATLAPDGSTWMTEMRAAGERIEQASNGEVKFKFYPGGVMGNDATVMRKIRVGQLQGGALTGSELSILYRDAQIYSLPFLFEDEAGIVAVREAVDPVLRAGLEDKGMIAVAITGVGFAYLMSKHDIATREGLQRAKVWMPQNDTIAEATFEAGGIDAIPLPLSDAFTSLQTGLIDTVATTPTGAIALQWHTALNHVIDLPLSYVVAYVVLDARSFRRLDEAQQALVRAQFAEAAGRIDAANRADNASALAALEAQGLTVARPSPDEVERWRQIGASVRGSLVEAGTISAETLAAIEAALESTEPTP